MTEQHGHHRSDSAPASWRKKSGNNPYSGSKKRYSGSDLPLSFSGRGSGYHEKMTRHDYELLEQSVLDYFQKKFDFNPPLESWTLPDPCTMFIDDKYQEERLQQLKQELNAVKSKLNNFNLSDWHKHTRFMNKAGDIQWKLRKEIEPEFVTQAWCKFYENVMSFPLVPPAVVSKGCLNSVHLCEAPGAFITSLNHFLKLHHPNIEWKWQATTLNPYYEGNPLSYMINDDRFILQTLKHWKFGIDYTGDLMNLENMLSLVKDAEEMGEVLLVTADGSIDCQEDPGEQESIVASLHYCETVAALHILAPGGSFLLKMFTMYEHETICLMFLLCCSFTGVHVCKPATSKEGNSEVYVVCLEYKGKTVMEPWLKVLRKHFGPELPKKAMFPYSSLPKDFMDQLFQCATIFKKYQTDVIETNIRVYSGIKKHNEEHINRKLRLLISNHFMEIYEMQKLPEKDEVVGKTKLKKTMTLNMDPRAEEGSFEDRRKKATLEPLPFLKLLKEEVNSMDIEWPFAENMRIMEFPVCVDGFEIKIGKPVKNVQSSKFCLGRLLRIRNQVRSIARKDFSRSFSNPSSPALPNGDNLSMESELSEMLRKHLKKTRPRTNLTILNYKEKLWTSIERGNETAERNAFWDIMDTFDDLWRDDNLLLQGYPMLTQFNVGIVYMLCHLFDEVGFVKPNKQDFGVVFMGFRQWNPKMKKFLDEVDDTIQRLKDEERFVTPASVKESVELVASPEVGSGDHSVIDEEAICDNLFYQCVTEVNHLCVKEQVLDIIENIMLQ
ncbi:hypothetical protein C0J52_02913 [Blattella germanica]|nr:hypothetical protein C0J52_02913 [Blattella germanica]